LKAAAFGVRQTHLDRLRVLGVSIAWLADAPTYPFGAALCEADRSGRYQPGDGTQHLIIPVVEDGELVDLCAFRSDNSGNWSLRTGNGWALGLGRGMEPFTWGLPVHVYSDPLDWLRGKGEGLCILDWGSPEIHRLDVLENVICSDAETEALLRQALTRPARVPSISVMETANVS
jgi:hypothetical protein